MPIPDAADFRIDLGAAETAQVRSEIESRVNDQIAEAMKGLYGRVQGTIAKLAEALKSEQTEEIRHTLFMAIHNVLDVLPLLNVTGDKALDAIGAEIRDMVAGCDVKSLKASEPMRQAVLEQAEAILSKMTDSSGKRAMPNTTNQERAQRGAHIINAYIDRENDQIGACEAATDAVADILHAYCEGDEIEAEKVLSLAKMHFVAEVDEEVECSDCPEIVTAERSLLRDDLRDVL